MPVRLPAPPAAPRRRDAACRTRRRAAAALTTAITTALVGMPAAAAHGQADAIPAARPRVMSNAAKLAVRQAVRSKSVLVNAWMPDSTGVRGSGFVVWRSGATAVLLTNAHVAMPGGVAPRALTVRPFGATRPLAAYLITALDERARGLDYAFLVATDSAGVLGEPVERGPAPEAGDPVVAVGNPLDEDFLVDAGAVSRIEATPTGAMIVHSALIDHGSSGGGLFNAEGQLVGVNTYVTTTPGEEQQGIALATEPLLARVRFHGATVPAQGEGWQESGILVRPGATLNVVAMGAWRVSPWVAPVGAGGLADPSYARYSVAPATAHGALLYQVGPGGPVQGVDRWWRGAAPGAAFALVRGAEQFGTLRFRINDADVANNSGRLAVTVLEWRER